MQTAKASPHFLQIAFGLLMAVQSTTVSAQPHGEDGGTAARQHESPSLVYPENPPLPEGMTLDQVLDTAASPKPSHFPAVIHDSELMAFTLLEQLEFRIQEEGRDQFGWEGQGWIGYDYDRFVWKSEGEITFDGSDEGETETDLLYSRLVDPFWSLQVGAQYANEYNPDDYEDRWSGVVALQGLAPGMFEVDASFYLSEDADVTAALEAEYNLRLTQRLILQPRAEFGFAAQDIEERGLGAGLTDGILDLRLRYEVKREFAPYVGLRYRFLAGETANLAEDAGSDTESFFLLAGLRLAF